MSTAAPSTVPAKAPRVASFYGELIGKKIAMALSGVVLFGYVVGHMGGNLQIFLGRQKINEYAAFLHSTPSLLWGVRALLLVAVVVHAWTAISLTSLSSAARPVAYKRPGQRRPNFAARTMIWSGIVLAAFIVFHLLHLTTGHVHPTFKELRPYENMVSGFAVLPVAIFYVVSVALLGLHLFHGIWSMCQSVGISHPRVTPALKKLSMALALVLAVGFAAVPIAVMTGFVR